MVGAGGCRWSVSDVVGGRFLFLRMVGGRCFNQYMVGGRWLMVGGLWSVVGGWSVGDGFVLRPPVRHCFTAHVHKIGCEMNQRCLIYFG